MLKELTKRLPFMQLTGKRMKSRENQGPQPEPAPLEEILDPMTEVEDEIEDEDRTVLEEVGELDLEPIPSEDRETQVEPELLIERETDAQVTAEPVGQSAENLQTEQDLKLGLAACREKNYVEALEAFLRAAEQGSVEAQFLCGQMYQRGLAVEASDRQALAWYKRAAKQGFLHAQTSCASLYEEGKGTEMDLKRALYWYEQAAKQGSAEAQLKCGVMYSTGRAETRNPKKARRWLEAAAVNGNAEALRILQERF